MKKSRRNSLSMVCNSSIRKLVSKEVIGQILKTRGSTSQDSKERFL
jgi:hypothetical protein